jgi:hypothetical protein
VLDDAPRRSEAHPPCGRAGAEEEIKTTESTHDFGFDRRAEYHCVRAICFWAIDRFARDRRLANLLKLLVVLICLSAIQQRVLPLAGINY